MFRNSASFESAVDNFENNPAELENFLKHYNGLLQRLETISFTENNETSYSGTDNDSTHSYKEFTQATALGYALLKGNYQCARIIIPFINDFDLGIKTTAYNISMTQNKHGMSSIDNEEETVIDERSALKMINDSFNPELKALADKTIEEKRNKAAKLVAEAATRRNEEKNEVKTHHHTHMTRKRTNQQVQANEPPSSIQLSEPSFKVEYSANKFIEIRDEFKKDVENNSNSRTKKFKTYKSCFGSSSPSLFSRPATAEQIENLGRASFDLIVERNSKVNNHNKKNEISRIFVYESDISKDNCKEVANYINRPK